MREPFVIARGTLHTNEIVEVRITADGVTGRGCAHGVTYAGETVASMTEDAERARDAVEADATREELLALMPAGGARCAIDAALWDLAAKRDGVSPFAANGVIAAPVRSARTIGIRSPDAFATAARDAADATLKIKVDARDPLAAIEAVRRGAPHAPLIVDPNQAWAPELLFALAPRLAELGVVLLEQPIAVGAEAALDGWESPVPLCADELIDDVADLAKARGRFAAVNIKLEKTGGLTAALRLADAAEAAGFALMVGCMGGPSLAMAPAMVLAQRCRWVDLDGPLFQVEDDADSFAYADGLVARPHLPALWG